jgi:hypothetical protein
MWHHKKWGMFGMLQVPGGAVYATVEPPWKDNKPNISCIPEGEYKLKLSQFTREDRSSFPCLEVCNVPGGRYAIKFHPANWARELKGCIAPGMALSFKDVWHVNHSKKAFDQIMIAARMLADDDLTLLVKDEYYESE